MDAAPTATRPPAMDAAPTATRPPAVGAGVAPLQAQVERLARRVHDLEGVVSDASVALGFVLDDPCEPAQRRLLEETRDQLADSLKDPM